MIPVPNRGPLDTLGFPSDSQITEAYRKQVAFDIMGRDSPTHIKAMNDRAASNRAGFMTNLFFSPFGEGWRQDQVPTYLGQEYLSSDEYRTLQPYSYYYAMAEEAIEQPERFQMSHPELYDQLKQLHHGQFP